MKAKQSMSNFEPLPAGNYQARLYQILYIGEIPVDWQGNIKWQDKIRLTFEFPTELKEFKEGEGEKPFVLSTEMTFSMHPKSKFRPMIESWLGKKMTDEEASEFDADSLLGKEAMVNVVHKDASNGNTYANISSVSPLMKGIECPPAINGQTILSYENWNQDIFNDLPEFLQAKMKTSHEYQSMFGETIKAEKEDEEKSPFPDSEEEINIDDIKL